MAGLGRKVFNAGEVLSAANVQGYLQDQVVQVYSGTAARSSALGTAVSEGMMSYLTDSNELSVYTSNGTAAWSPVNLSQSPNAIINGAFDINQRNFTSVTTEDTFIYDRFKSAIGSGTGTTTITSQTFTLGTAPVAGYEGKNFLQIVSAAQTGANDWSGFRHKIESVRTFAGQTVTFSFWAKSASGTPNVAITMEQYFGSGGSSSVYVAATPVAISSSWARYSVTVSLPSIAGKTITTNDSVIIYIFNSTGSTLTGLGFANAGLQNNTFSYWGLQLEAGSVATPFRRSSPTLQGELAACQRYAVAFGGRAAYEFIGSGSQVNTTNHRPMVQLPVTMRTTPSSITVSSNAHFAVDNGTAFTATITSITLDTGTSSPSATGITTVTSSGIGSAGGNVRILANNTTSALLVVSAEL